MKIGLLKEIKNLEGRVALTPLSIREILKNNSEHEIYVQSNAGVDSGYSDYNYRMAGAKILNDAKSVYEKAQLIVHIKEFLPEEYQFLRSDHILFTYLHLAAEPDLTKKLMEIGCAAFGYETLEDAKGDLPLLEPMSKVAGKMAFVYSLYLQQEKTGGKGLYLGAIDGITYSKCLIIGGGVVGTNVAESLVGIGAHVTILEKSEKRRQELKILFPDARILEDKELENEIKTADVIIGAVLIHGAKAPKLIKKEHLSIMKKGTVIIDISIDQGGISELSKPTSIKEPSYIVDGIVFCCIPNIPGTVPKSSTELITMATLPYVIQLANDGLLVLDKDEFKTSLNIYKGKCVNKAVAEATGVEYTDLNDLI